MESALLPPFCASQGHQELQGALHAVSHLAGPCVCLKSHGAGHDASAHAYGHSRSSSGSAVGPAEAQWCALVRSEETALLGGRQIQALDDDQSRNLCLAHLFSALSQVAKSQQGTYVLRTVGSNKFCSGMGQFSSMFWGT